MKNKQRDHELSDFVMYDSIFFCSLEFINYLCKALFMHKLYVRNM